ncbi:Tetratricopeptide repeat protein [Rubrivivax sp. A210]|uniref:tetratricopeptide repeat protein n=1 Tax=Rubrivivax sp. A210 TaxID=2772301 RepID=UPI001919E8AB|nr:tetratricopeptide repeat protein [Rubrivivax sp. A210]CAD5369306.1 Tetratricopeptide repeat protein [Rubrivivax sp. A210]
MNTSAADLSIPELLQATMQAHIAGNLDVAAKGYRLLQGLAPDHPDVLHLSGVFESQSGSRERGHELISRAIAIDGKQAMFHNNLGLVCVRMGRLEEAERCYRRAIELDPDRFDAFSNLGVLLGQLDRLEDAEQEFLRLLERVPRFADARQNLAGLYLRQGRFSEAIEQCAKGLVTDPRNPLLRRVLGRAYADAGLIDQSLELYRKWQKEEPDHPEPRHHIAAITGENVPDRASDDYVLATFRNFAETFDAKLAQLGYRAPALVGESLVELLAETPPKSLRVIDAGCGTGLCAEQVAPWTRNLVGVDLSRQMLDRAAAREAYDELVEAELVAFLQTRPACCDLLISADTLCYFGRLDEFAAAARRSMLAGAWLVFTVEAHDDGEGQPDYRIYHHGRYSHRHGYVYEVLAGNGFGDISLREVVLRQEGGKPVRGWLTRARVPQGAEGHE